MSRFSRVTPAECDRCSFIVPHSELRRQTLWQGTQLIDTGLLVCADCFDNSDPEYRRKYTDPKPVKDPRPPRETFITVPPLGGEVGHWLFNEEKHSAHIITAGF